MGREDAELMGTVDSLVMSGYEKGQVKSKEFPFVVAIIFIKGEPQVCLILIGRKS